MPRQKKERLAISWNSFAKNQEYLKLLLQKKFIEIF